MQQESARKEIEQKLAAIDPIGSEIRKLKNKVTKLEKKGTVTAKEWQDISKSHIRIAELEAQRKEMVQFESMLDPVTGKLMKLSKAFDKLTAQYDMGKVDPKLYNRSLERLLERLSGHDGVQGPSALPALLNGSTGSIGGDLWRAIEQAFGAVVIFGILIPVLFSCSGH